jgi:hypothetical protein
MAYKIFISSGLNDKDLVKDLERRLEPTGIKVLSSHKDFRGGELISKQITKGIRDADEVIVILSNESVDNPNLMFELGAASSMKKRVTPVIVGLDPSRVPSLIKSFNYIKYPDISRYIIDLEKRAKAA